MLKQEWAKFHNDRFLNKMQSREILLKPNLHRTRSHYVLKNVVLVQDVVIHTIPRSLPPYRAHYSSCTKTTFFYIT